MLPFKLQPKGRFSPGRYLKILVGSILPQQAAFSGVELFFWAAMASDGMLAMYLQSLGMSASEVGTLLAFLATAGIFSPPFWGMMSDRLRSVKRVIFLLFSTATVLWALVPFVLGHISITSAWVILPLFRFFNGPVSALLDSWIVRTTYTDRRMSFGSIRTFGSLGYAIAAVVYTFLIKAFSINVIFIGFVTMAVPMLVIMANIKGDDQESKRAISMKELRAGIGQLMKLFPYVSFLLFSVILNIPVNASFTFLSFHLKSIGEDPALLGTVLGLKALVEIPLLLLSGKLIKKFAFPHLLLAVGCVYVLEMFLYPLCGSFYSVLAVQCMHGAMFGLYISAQIQYIYSLAPPNLTATAQTFTGASLSLASIAGNILGGLVIDTLGINMLFIISAFIQLAAVLLFALSLRYSAKKQKAAA